jgi:putative ABC transport system permease protein
VLRLIYLYRNLTRNLRRTALTVAAVGLPITIFVLATAVIDGINRFLDNSAKQLRLAVTQKASIVNPLPAGYRTKIESLDPTKTRLLSVCGMRWLGGTIENDPRPLATLAADHDSFADTFPEQKLTQDQIDAWLRDRRALIVGRATARQFGWQAGDRVTIRASLPPYQPMEFHIVSTGENANDPITNFCRRDYVEELVKGTGWLEDWVSFIFVKCASQEDLDHYRVAIDKLFARTPDETKTQDEKAFMNEFITQQFNLPRNLTILAAVTIFVAVMAAANTMSMNFRDRMNEVAILKSLGFRSTLVFTLIQTESLTVCAWGGILGAGIPYLAFTHTPLRNFTIPLIQTLEIYPVVCAQAVVISLAVGVVAAAWPSWSALRMTVVSALRNLE